LSKPNKSTIKTLRELEKYILEEPKRFNMSFWGLTVDPNYYDKVKKTGYLSSEESALVKQKPTCGTVGCMAGNLCVMTGKIKPKIHFNGAQVYHFPHNTALLASEILGISPYEGEKLFMLSSWTTDGNGWPVNFSTKLMTYSPGTKQYAQVVVDRIEHYIATGE
jgi:hypothetical protein